MPGRPATASERAAGSGVVSDDAIRGPGAKADRVAVEGGWHRDDRSIREGSTQGALIVCAVSGWSREAGQRNRPGMRPTVELGATEFLVRFRLTIAFRVVAAPPS